MSRISWIVKDLGARGVGAMLEPSEAPIPSVYGVWSSWFSSRVSGMALGCCDGGAWMSMSTSVSADGARWSLGFEGPALARSLVPCEVRASQL